MPVRHAEAVWQGTLREGSGVMKTGSGACEGAFSFPSRFEEGEGTNPEELVGAAHAGCFSMFLSAVLVRNGFTPRRISTTADVRIEQVDGAFTITTIDLNCKAEVPDLDNEKLQEYAQISKENCPVSKALSGVDIRLAVDLVT